MPSEQTIAQSIKLQFITSIRKAMQAKGVSQSELARRMLTSRAVVHRMLKVDDTGLTLHTLAKSASALGVGVKVRLVKA